LKLDFSFIWIARQAGHTKLIPTPGKDQSIVTGCGGPSGTGKRPAGEPVLPPPVFLQDNPPAVSQQPSKAGSRTSVPSQPVVQNVDSARDDDQPPQTPQPIILPKSSSTVTENNSLKAEVIVSPSQNRKSIATSALESKAIESLKEIDVTVAEDKKAVAEPRSDGTRLVSLTAENLTSFNGVTWNAVFPVPTSSLSSPIWSAILRVSHSNLSSNPFQQSKLSVAEIMELTLPPVDAAANVPWPKPQSYYASSMLSASTESGKRQDGDIIKNAVLAKTSQIIGAIDYDAGKVSNTINNSFSALRQLFPGVNLTYGGSPAFVGNGNR
jgi:hypothetical protein